MRGDLQLTSTWAALGGRASCPGADAWAQEGKPLSDEQRVYASSGTPIKHARGGGKELVPHRFMPMLSGLVLLPGSEMWTVVRLFPCLECCTSRVLSFFQKSTAVIGDMDWFQFGVLLDPGFGASGRGEVTTGWTERTK